MTPISSFVYERVGIDADENREISGFSSNCILEDKLHLSLRSIQLFLPFNSLFGLKISFGSSTCLILRITSKALPCSRS